MFGKDTAKDRYSVICHVRMSVGCNHMHGLVMLYEEDVLSRPESGEFDTYDQISIQYITPENSS